MRFLYTTLFIFLLISFSSAQTSRDVTVNLTASYNTATHEITLTWKKDTTCNYYAVYKKSKDVVKWDSIAKVAKSLTTYTDALASKGNCYEYMVIKRHPTLSAVSYVLAGAQRDLPYNRGKMILLVDKNYAIPLSAEISRLQDDLFGDGWQVIRHDVNRTDAVTAVKQLILNDFNADKDQVRSVFILGHVPVPYSGGFSLAQYYPPDGHPDHVGAWPADMYYGTMNESIWTDASFNNVSGSRTENRNTPGDGKFDIPYIYGDTVTLEVGRVDLYNMPAFGLSDTLLVKRYLNKSHNFKMGVNVGAKKGYVLDNFGFMGGEAFASSGWRALTPMFGDSVTSLAANTWFSTLDVKSSQFVYGTGGGSYTSASGVGSTSNYVSDSTLYNFSMLFGSYFGDWDSQNNFLRAGLASKGWALSCSWSGRPYHYYHQMACGENLGSCIRISQNNYDAYEYNIYPTFVHTALMGDPSLRMNPVPPVSKVTLSTPADKKSVTVKWSKSPDANVTEYAIYRSKSRNSYFVYRGTVPATDTVFTDSKPYQDINYYMVKAIRPETTFSGIYMNTSIGMFDTISAVNPVGIESATAPVFSVYPNPAGHVLHLQSQHSYATPLQITIFDLNGREVLSRTWENSASSEQLNISQLTPGIYVLKIMQGTEQQYIQKLVRREE